MASIDINAGAGTPADANGVNRFYFAAWRWHFYAGIFVAPFLMMLATTGLIMLWVSMTTDLNGARTRVVPAGDPMAVSALAAAAAEHVGGTVTQYVEPRTADMVALFNVATSDANMAVLVDPYTATVVDSFVWDDNWYTFASNIHGTLLLGTFGDRMIEIAAGFAILLLVTGLYLWWPRNGTKWSTLLVPNLAARGRGLWKSLHQTIGFWVAAVLLVFLLTGMSWTGVWGEKIVQAFNTFPAAKWNAPLSDQTYAETDPHAGHDVPWTLEQTQMPMSGEMGGDMGVMGPVNIDTVVAYARSLGFVDRFQLNLPTETSGVWTISHDSMSQDGPSPSDDRTIHLDQYTGNVLADVRYADYSLYAKAMATGIAFHQGDMGLWNLVLNTVFCLSVIFISLSGLVMWWKRRPKGALRLAAPPMPANMPLWKGAVLVGLFVSMAFPLVGITLLVVLAADVLILSRLPALRRALS